MPIALDPALRVRFSLQVDRQQPDDQRPVFILRYLTCRQATQVESLIDQAADPAVSQSVRSVALNKALAVLIAGWKHLNDENGQPILYALGGVDRDELAQLGDDILTPAEKWELVADGLRAIRLSESDKKKLPSPPAIDTNASAAVAPSSV